MKIVFKFNCQDWLTRPVCHCGISFLIHVAYVFVYELSAWLNPNSVSTTGILLIAVGHVARKPLFHSPLSMLPQLVMSFW
ncbi:hypothetical protein HBH98_063570 [Parastagonospora nodorum]|nr:hypothetical protein HBH53_050730 [Parastagonospora nodorum]KAH3995614.1 hypothetical protein HBI10_168270 [Parastagonospora nodorum]KAH4015737.1 hypothetical protein HBI13_157860 [Parastagonospora nodorum]KAH4045753.1 hypothetical protein HBH49_194970 [Parastagonospora nodorum]KAH4305222.1 hypothetical protein HBI01_067490 [Parastagonospora nodorum]